MMIRAAHPSEMLFVHYSKNSLARTKMENFPPYQVDIDGQSVTIRPVTNEDVDLENDFVNKLSAESKHFRFLGGVNHLSTQQLKILCDIDFNHRMAFLASITIQGKEEQIGVSRYALDTEKDSYEFAVTIADQWQHKGLGTLLMRKLIEFAKERHVKQLYSIDLADNTHMQQLAKDLGMQSKRDPEDAHQVIYSLDLE